MNPQLDQTSFHELLQMTSFPLSDYITFYYDYCEMTKRPLKVCLPHIHFLMHALNV